jgi:hypothetical protein
LRQVRIAAHERAITGKNLRSLASVRQPGTFGAWTGRPSIACNKNLR